MICLIFLWFDEQTKKLVIFYRIVQVNFDVSVGETSKQKGVKFQKLF